MHTLITFPSLASATASSSCASLATTFFIRLFNVLLILPSIVAVAAGRKKKKNLLSTQGHNIGIKHGFSCINICQVPWEMLKTEAEGRTFQHLPRDLANVNASKNHVRSWRMLMHSKTMFDHYYCIKTENIFYISHYFLHYFVSPFY